MQKSFYWAFLSATFFMGASFVSSKILLKTIPPFTLVGWYFLQIQPPSTIEDITVLDELGELMAEKNIGIAFIKKE